MRINISIKDDLKARMDVLACDVNWSRVASEAFERKLSEMEARDLGSDISEQALRVQLAAMAEDNGKLRAQEQKLVADISRLESDNCAYKAVCENMSASLASATSAMAITARSVAEMCSRCPKKFAS